MFNYQPFPPAVSLADIASGQAANGRGIAKSRNRKLLLSGAQTVPVVPAGLTAPSAAVIALIPMTATFSGFVTFKFNLTYTLSAAGTVTASVIVNTQPTPATGGTTTNGILWESSAITVPAGSLVVDGANYQGAFVASDLVQTMNLAGDVILPVGVACSFIFNVSSAVNLGTMGLICSAYEV